jgi:DtxR family Mn-dependent transcriptional regulator
VETLGYSWDEVHEEAERLEHVISEDLEQRIAAALGHPARDPHGELIPTEDLNMPADDSVPLSSLRPHQTATILRVNAHDPSLLRHLNSLGLIPGIQIEVTDYSSYDYNLTIKTQNKITVLGSNVTTKIFVQVGKKE